ncbi:hypothetical protein [Methylobacterium pseudosasicola]|uniref:Uncharacterized protein n=1 Tax=Methylobacterium pseudosasicola TaxID=582667 RepID=A0A1I4H4B1_9HYPH|nr:hypothetical protein [Methylobacterium pseudosasicola]SFL37079.1 hypothetical protein SAMN05192568_100426 [Methylobacterium pseudosasicola]
MADLRTDAAREPMLILMSALNARIIATNVLADELIQAADTTAGPPLAAAMLDRARRYRIEVPELQGRLAVLSDQYTERFQGDL